MKRLPYLITVIFLLITIFGCKASPKYRDGTYTAKADPWQFGQEEATVMIKDDKILDISLRKLDKSGKEINYDDWAGQIKDSMIYPNIKQYRVSMAKNMIKRQTYDVDTISGATMSSNNWRIAVQRALDEAKY